MRAKDRLVLYTDGLIEAFNPQEEEFGLGQLLENLSTTRSLALNESLKILAKCAADWHGSSRQRDDISLLAFDYKPQRAHNYGPKLKLRWGISSGKSITSEI
jgi:sigma-B regulation protein RsbU (phosphoserine phosphatase)